MHGKEGTNERSQPGRVNELDGRTEEKPIGPAVIEEKPKIAAATRSYVHFPLDRDVEY